jgi:hypothetical protein
MWPVMDLVLDGRRSEIGAMVSEPLKQRMRFCWAKDPERTSFEEITAEMEKPQWLEFRTRIAAGSGDNAEVRT